MSSPRLYEHAVVGAVHEVVVTSDDPAVLAEAIAHELIDCDAIRFVVDISAIDEIGDEHLRAVSTLAEVSEDRSAVRVNAAAYPHLERLLTAAGVRDVITDRSPGRPGRPEGLTDASPG